MKYFMIMMMVFVIAGCSVTADPGEADVEVSFTAPGDDWDVGTASCYQARYTIDTVNGPWVYIDCGILPLPNEAGTSETIVLPGLPSNSHLLIQVRAADELEVKKQGDPPTRNYGVWSNTLEVDTPDNIIPGQITDLRL